LLSLAESLRESLQDYTSSSINNTQDREKYILSVQPGPRVKKEQNSLCSGGRTGKNTPKVLQRKKKKGSKDKNAILTYSASVLTTGVQYSRKARN